MYAFKQLNMAGYGRVCAAAAAKKSKTIKTKRLEWLIGKGSLMRDVVKISLRHRPQGPHRHHGIWPGHGHGVALQQLADVPQSHMTEVVQKHAVGLRIEVLEQPFERSRFSGVKR